MHTKTYERAKAQLTEHARLDVSTVCVTCGTAYIPNPEIPNDETCGLCKARLKAFYAHMESLGAR